MRQALRRSGRVVWHTTLGGVLLVAGVVMLVTPGPGLLAIALGLAVLAREFTWADRAKQAVLARIRDARDRAHAAAAARRTQRDAHRVTHLDDARRSAAGDGADRSERQVG